MSEISLPKRVSPREAHIEQVHKRMNLLREDLHSVIPSHLKTITWEVGCGHGHFLVKYASLYPDRMFMGIDILGDRLKKAGKKRQLSGLQNVCFVKAEAEEFLQCLPLGVAIDEVIVLFPDPWPKKRHHKNRLIQSSFLVSLAARMTNGGRFFFRTDHKPYLDWTAGKIDESQAWELIPNAPWVLDEPTVFQKKASGFGSLVARLKTPS